MLNHYDEGRAAALRGDTGCLLGLLARGLEPGATDSHGLGETLLVAACRAGRFAAVRLLVERGASVRSIGHPAKAPLVVAAGEGRLNIAKYLVEHGAPIDHETGEHGPLAAAAGAGHAGIVEYLLGCGAAVDARGFDLKTALLVTIESAPATIGASSADEIAARLLAAGASPDLADADGWTPLMYAAVHDDDRSAASLIRAGANQYVANHDGESPRTIARRLGARRVLAVLDSSGSLR